MPMIENFNRNLAFSCNILIFAPLKGEETVRFALIK